MAKNLSNEDLKNLITGSAFLASGGGGNLQMALGMLQMMQIRSISVGTLDLYEVGTTTITDVVVGFESGGAGDGMGGDPSKLLEILKKRVCNLYDTYVTRIGGKPVKYIMPMETGAYNVLFTCFIIQTLNEEFNLELSLLDVDFTGRAVPCLEMAIPSINNSAYPICPFGFINLLGDTVIKEIIEDALPAELDAFIRKVLEENKEPAVVGYGWNTSDPELIREWGINKALLRGLTIGKIMNSGEPDIEVKVIEFINSDSYIPTTGSYDNAYVIADKGKVVSLVNNSAETGFNFVNFTIEDSKGNKVLIVNKNENLLAWDLNSDKPRVIGPDLICMMGENGYAITWENLKEGMENVTIVGVCADEKMRDTKITTRFLVSINEAVKNNKLSDKIPDITEYVTIEELNN